MRVRATERGYYGGMIREVGDVFTIAGRPDLGRWMAPISPLDHDEDGRKGGSKPGRRRAAEPVEPVDPEDQDEI